MCVAGPSCSRRATQRTRSTTTTPSSSHAKSLAPRACRVFLSHMNTFKYASSHSHTDTHKHLQSAHINTHTHTHTRSHSHSLTHTHTHTHSTTSDSNSYDFCDLGLVESGRFGCWI